MDTPQRSPATVVSREFGAAAILPDHLPLRLVKDPGPVLRFSTSRWQRNHLPPDGTLVYLVRTKAGDFRHIENAAGERLGNVKSW
jgi:hypothetical protein